MKHVRFQVICATLVSYYISNSHYYIGKSNLGSGTNNVGLFEALFYLMKFAIEQVVLQLLVYEDSSLTMQ